ncbi:hypothetical protein [Alcaligenes sp.]|uniref:hypothetical protein n=1 Tax=Alcaligenes sp. TaxID=512 RepID=UPI003D019039
MRISRSDVDLWRAKEVQGLRRLAEASPFASQEKRPDPAPKRAAGNRSRLVDRTELASAVLPVDDQLSDTAGNIAILKHLLDTVLPTLALPDDVHHAAASLLFEDMDHHLRVLDAALAEKEADGKDEQEAEPDGRLE